MKKLVKTLILPMLLVLSSCGGSKVDPETCEHNYVEDAAQAVASTCTEAGKKVEVCSICGDIKESEVKKLGHDYKEDSTKSKAATCAAAGEKVEICSRCKDEKKTAVAQKAHSYKDYAGDATHKVTTASCATEGVTFQKCENCNDIKEVKTAKTEHNFGTKQEVKVSDKVSYSTSTCSACKKVDYALNALNWKNISGDNKDSTNETLKLKSDNDYTEYEFNMPKAVANAEVGLYGWVNLSNDGESFFSGGSGSANIEIEVNGVKVEITNKATYEEMGMVADTTVTSRCAFTLCMVGGTANLKQGTNTVKYTRTASYNMNITEIHFIG